MKADFNRFLETAGLKVKTVYSGSCLFSDSFPALLLFWVFPVKMTISTSWNSSFTVAMSHFPKASVLL